MVTVNSLLGKILKEFTSKNDAVAIKSEGSILIIKIGKTETRIANWETLTENEIVEIARGTVNENFTDRTVLLKG